MERGPETWPRSYDLQELRVDLFHLRTVYTGEFQFGFKHGKGKMAYVSGNYYDGDWKYDKKNGYGEMYWLTTNEIYKGFWEENLQNGFGTHIWLEEPGKLKTMRNRYEGTWFNGQRSGYGTFYYSDGSRYDGEWLNNQKEGFAVFLDPSGDYMEAIFKNDRLFKRLNEPRKIKMTALVPEASEDEQPELKRKNIRVKNGKKTHSRPQTSTKKTDRSMLRSTLSKQKPTEIEPDENTKKEDDFIKRNLENQVLNPYLKLLRVDDLLETVKDREEVLNQLEISLLHHNSMFSDIFKEYKSLRTNITQFSCTMTLKTMWKFLKDARILSPLLSLANFDRYFYSNPHNVFPLHFNFDDVRQKLKKLKKENYKDQERKLDILFKLDNWLRNDSVKINYKKLDYENLSESCSITEAHAQAQIEQDPIESNIKEQMEFMDTQHFKEHFPENIVQFRNFIDGFIRAAYIRENFNFETIGEEIEQKYIKYRLEPIVHTKRHLLDKVYGVEEELKVKNYIEDYMLLDNELSKDIFRKHLSKRMGFKKDVEKLTSDVKATYLLLKKAGVLSTQEEEIKFLKISERYFDPDSSYVEMVSKKMALSKHFTRAQTLELNYSMLDNIEGDSAEQDKSMNINKSPLNNSSEQANILTKSNGPPEAIAQPNNLKERGLKIQKIEEESDISDKHKNSGSIKQDSGSKPQNLSINKQDSSDAPDITKKVSSLATDFESQQMGDMLSKVMGHELLYFEFIENILIYMLQTVSLNLARTESN